jgi:hypothetical protein
VADVEAGRFGSCHAAQQAYGVRGNETVPRWVRQYGKSHLLGKVVRVQKQDELSELALLKAQVKQLKAFALDMAMDRALEKAAFDMVCEQQGIDPVAFKIKLASSGSADARANGRRRGK